MTSITVQDYLKQLYLEQHAEDEQARSVSTGRIASAMGVTPGTATSMLKYLAGAGLVTYETRRGARLTARGEREALEMLRRHRLLEMFLVRILGLDWTEVHDEAESLEHAVSHRVLAQIDALLGSPTVDPHGDPIPGPEGHVELPRRASLATCPLGEAQRVCRIRDQTPDFLRFVERARLMPGAEVAVEGRDAPSETVHIRAAAGGATALGLVAAAKILVLPVAAE